ncbi:MAG: TIGR00282 family metallophosphoesterase [Planctomycetota bacterium]
MRILLIGDIVGKPGRLICAQVVRALKSEQQIDLVIANAENAAGGSGITPAIYQELVTAGVDVVTLGDHAYRRREIFGVMQSKPNIVRPANYPAEAPGNGFALVRSALGVEVAVVVLQGRVFMSPVDCPFHAADRVLGELPSTTRVIVVDFHAEATSDKQLMGRHLDGRVSAVLGTHTHVPTADEQILPGGTALQCDVGMTGPHESILGRRIDRVLETALSYRPTHFEVATGDVRLNGSVVDIDPHTGKATAIRRLRVDEDQAREMCLATRRGGFDQAAAMVEGSSEG